MDVETILKNHSQKISPYTPCRYSMSTIWAFYGIENKHDGYRSEDCMINFCKSLKERGMKIINFEKKKMIPLTNEQQESYEKTICYICKKKIVHKYINDKQYSKVGDHCHYPGKYIGAAHNICNLKYSITKEIHVVFHNGPNYDYHFIIEKLVNEFEG